MEHRDRVWTVHVCARKGAAARGSPYGLEQHIAHMHQQLARHGGVTFEDRTLSFQPGPVPDEGQELPAWYVARRLWREQLYPDAAIQDERLRRQPIHGDLHWDNIVTGVSPHKPKTHIEMILNGRAGGLMKL
ncbi:hypothetical protein ABGB14_37040 [Nonomuraea sp. B10E15]|uniref:hypothetical protein n=1 Tax=Nonomuraea sp. B10E15 TaxID=3153560 RepID=UPI00325D2340